MASRTLWPQSAQVFPGASQTQIPSVSSRASEITLSRINAPKGSGAATTSPTTPWVPVWTTQRTANGSSGTAWGWIGRMAWVM